MPRKGKPGRTRGKGKKPKKTRCEPRKLVNPEPAGGNPPLNSNVITGSRALECCEENSEKDAKLLNEIEGLFKTLRDKVREQFDFNERVDRTINILFGNPFDKEVGRAYAELPVTVTEFQQGYPRVTVENVRTPGGVRTGLFAFSIPAFQYLYTLYDTREHEVAEETLTQTLEMLKLMKSVRKKTKTNSCFECIKAALLRQSKHKKITLEPPTKPDA